MTDLDRALREMLRARAEDIPTLPPHLLTLDGAPAGWNVTPAGEPLDNAQDTDILAFGPRAERRPRVRRYWPAPAAAALVAIVAGILAVFAAHPDQGTPPADPASVPTVTRTACRTVIPPSWDAPVRSATRSLQGVADVFTLAVTRGGGAIVDYTGIGDDNVVPTQLVGYLAPGASTVRPLAAYRPPAGSAARQNFNLDVDVDGRTALVSVVVGNGLLNVHEIDVLDIVTGRRRVVATSSAHDKNRILTQGYVQDGRVYWETTQQGRGVHLRVLSRGIAGGPARVVSRSPLARLTKSALGVEWTAAAGSINRPASVPAVVARLAAGDPNLYIAFDSYVTDGTAYAWQAQDGSLEWFSPRAGQVVRVPGLLGEPGTDQGLVLAVAGPLVLFQTADGRQVRVLDTRTGASLNRSALGSFLGSAGAAIGDPILLPATGHDAASGSLMRVDTADLPPAHC